MNYNPVFTRKPEGQFNIDNNFIAVKHGSNTILLEDELNESQWIQNELRAQSLRSIMNSGFFYKNFNILDTNSDLNESIYVKGYGNPDLESNAILFNIKGHIPVNINGYIFNIAGTYKKDLAGNTTDNNNILLKLPSPPTLEKRFDLVYLEAWFEEISYDDSINYNGGIDNYEIGKFNKDTRINIETSHRIQLKWKIRVAEGVTDLLNVNAIGNMKYPSSLKYGMAKDYPQLSFCNDNNLYVSLNNQGVLNGIIYALPILQINRSIGNENINIKDITNKMIQYPLNIQPHEIPYNNSTYTDIKTLKDAMDVSLYFNPEVLINNNIEKVEIGTVVNDVILNWTINKNDIISQNINNNIGEIDIIKRNYNITNANLKSDTTYTITVNDGKNTVTNSTKILFLNKIYYGLSNKETLGDADILNLSNELSSNFIQTRKFECTNKYIYFAWPESYGIPIIIVNGLVNNAWVITKRNFINSKGHSESYYIYRSKYLQNGTNILISLNDKMLNSNGPVTNPTEPSNGGTTNGPINGNTIETNSIPLDRVIGAASSSDMDSVKNNIEILNKTIESLKVILSSNDPGQTTSEYWLQDLDNKN